MHRLRTPFAVPCRPTLSLRPRYRAVALMLMSALAGVALPAGAQTASAAAGGLPLQPATLAEGAKPADTAPSAANSPPADNAAPADEMATMVATLQKQIIAQQALLQTLQARLSAGTVSPTAQARPAAPASGAPVLGGAERPDAKTVPAPSLSVRANSSAATSPPDTGQERRVTARQTLNTPPASPVPARAAPLGLTEEPAAALVGADRALSTQAQRQAYASGAAVWREIQSSITSQQALGIDLDARYVMDGLQDMALNRPLKMSGDEMDRTLSALNADYNRRANEVRLHQESEGRAYRIAFSKQKGAYSDAGAWYRIDDHGQGRHLRTTDMAVLQVTGTLPDGTVFDASGQQGHTRTVKVGALLPSVAIGLQKVAPGGHLTVVVPPQKGYGDAGLPPSIPGGATLIFDITVKGLGRGE